MQCSLLSRRNFKVLHLESSFCCCVKATSSATSSFAEAFSYQHTWVRRSSLASKERPKNFTGQAPGMHNDDCPKPQLGRKFQGLVCLDSLEWQGVAALPAWHSPCSLSYIETHNFLCFLDLRARCPVA